MNRYYKHISKIFSEAIDSVNPNNAIKRCLHREGSILTLTDRSIRKKFDLNQFKRVFIIGAGKATAPMAAAIEEIIGDRITEGLICVKYKHALPLKKIRTVEAAHPVPDQNGLNCAQEILSLLHDADKDDMVISLISGGGSALLALPDGQITLEDLVKTTNVLLKCGATIHEINTVRKHISKTKGGKLAVAAHPATVINLLVSDVVGNDLDTIASGPFVPDSSRFIDALEILNKYAIAHQIPRSVVNHLRAGTDGTITETPTEKEGCFKTVFNIIAVSNYLALDAAAAAAEKLGYNTAILSSFLDGDTTQSAAFHLSIVREISSSGNPVTPPACILSGGENTVHIHGTGKGGRNTEFALQTAHLLQDIPGVYAASMASDGTDGPTDAAGAIVDSSTAVKAKKSGLDLLLYRDNNDSYNFFNKFGTLVKTGPTFTNVMDIHIFLVPE